MASRVRTFRLARGLSFPQLAAECARLQAPQLTVSSLTNIERGREEGAKRRRRDVTVEELAALAKALRVPPILLVLPLGAEPFVELLPGQQVPTWEAVEWWRGRGYFPTRTADGRWSGTKDDREAFEDGAAVIGYFEDHNELERALRDARAARSDDAPHAAQRLIDLRRNMRRAGILPPELDAQVADIEEGGTSGDQEG